MAASTYLLRLFNPNPCLAILLLSCLISSTLLATESQKLQLGIHQVGSWHASNDSQLVLEDHQHNQYMATLKPPCDGLIKAKSIAFISNGNNALDQSSTLVLPNGKRCPFKTFTQQPRATNP